MCAELENIQAELRGCRFQLNEMKRASNHHERHKDAFLAALKRLAEAHPELSREIEGEIDAAYDEADPPSPAG